MTSRILIYLYTASNDHWLTHPLIHWYKLWGTSLCLTPSTLKLKRKLLKSDIQNSCQNWIFSNSFQDGARFFSFYFTWSICWYPASKPLVTSYFWQKIVSRQWIFPYFVFKVFLYLIQHAWRHFSVVISRNFSLQRLNELTNPIEKLRD